MRLNRWKTLLLVAALLAGFSGTAFAAKLPMIFGTGDEMFEVDDFSADLVALDPALKDYKVAYKCQHFALLWADVWTWDCGLVAGQIEANSYADLPPEMVSQLSGKYSMGDAHRNFWNHYGIPLMVVGLIGMALLNRSKKTG